MQTAYDTTWMCMMVAAYQIVRLYHWLAIQLRFLNKPSRVYTSETYSLLYPDHHETQMIIPHNLPPDVIVVRNVMRHTMTGRMNRACVILPNEPEDPFDPVLPPWWFIGARLKNHEEVCLTDYMSAFVVAGNVITPRLLSYLHPELEKSLRYWFYIHPATFEETEIPPEGITIHVNRDPPAEQKEEQQSSDEEEQQSDSSSDTEQVPHED